MPIKRKLFNKLYFDIYMVTVDGTEFKLMGYERFFEVQGASYLFSSFYAKLYSDLGLLIINNDGFVSLFLDKNKVSKNQRDSFAFYSSLDEFQNYLTSFKQFLSESDSFFESILSKEKITSLDLNTYFKQIIKFFNFYKWTEFFYSDYSYIAVKDNSTLKNGTLENNLLQLGEIKTDGRILLNKIFNKSDSYLNRFLDKIAKLKPINRDDLKLLTYSEIVIYFDNGVVPKIDNRKNDFTLLTSPGLNLLKNALHQDFITEFKEQTSDVVKGIVACEGAIEGTVRVLDFNFDNFDILFDLINEMNDGEILVAETTSPDIFLACEKASAIVTNQGGVGSHAAIVSREMGIPCIVGTKDATKVLKTGDLVKVDAFKGVVQFIKKVPRNEDGK